MFQKLVFVGMQKGGVNSNIRLFMVHNLNYEGCFRFYAGLVVVVLGLKLKVCVVKVKSLKNKFLLCVFFCRK